MVGGLNRLFLRLGPIPIKIYEQILYAPTLDRFVVAMMQRFVPAESFELRLWKYLCKPGYVVLDVGSNMGLYAFVAASRVGARGRVWAFEADPVNVWAIQKGVAANGYDNTTVVAAAVTDYVGTISFSVREEHRGDGQIVSDDENRHRLDVPATTLDAALGDKVTVDLIKLDIQGAEVLAVKGMERILEASQRLKVISEFWPEGIIRCGSDANTFLGHWQEKGFAIALIDEKEQKLLYLSKDELIRRAYRERYVNIFLERHR